MQHWRTESLSDDTIESNFKVDSTSRTTPLLVMKDVFDVVPSEVNAVFDYTEYTRFGLWTSETISF